jgi:hypothetical protein
MSGYPRDIIWRNKYMNLKNKIKIYRTCVRPVMTYAIEAGITISKRLLRSTEMRTLRCITANTAG